MIFGLGKQAEIISRQKSPLPREAGLDRVPGIVYREISLLLLTLISSLRSFVKSLVSLAGCVFCCCQLCGYSRVAHLCHGPHRPSVIFMRVECLWAIFL